MRTVGMGLYGGTPGAGRMGNESDVFSYRRFWLHTIHVSTTGNDTTGDGSVNAPYKTLTKAMTVAVAGDGILVADGTYVETSGAGTAGYWTINKNLSDWLVIEPELGAAGNVTITGTEGASINIYFAAGGTSRYLKFRYLDFGMCASSTTVMRNGSTLSNIVFEKCTWTPITDAVTGFYQATTAFSDVTFIGCTWKAPSAGISYYAIRMVMASTNTGIIFDGCVINSAPSSQSAGLYAHTGSTLGGSLVMNNCVFNGWYGWHLITGGTFTISNCVANVSFGCTVGVDGTGDKTSALVKAVITNCTINKVAASAGHVLLFGNGCTECVADTISIPYSYDYALVLKEHTGTEVKNCNLVGGRSSALICKSVADVNVHHNVLIGSGSSGAFQLRNGDDPSHHCANWQLTNNIINVTGASKALNIGNENHDDGGGICDYNQYQTNNGLGTVRNDASVADLLELIAAWSDYDVTTNDAHSTII